MMKITPHILATTTLFAVGTGVAHAASSLDTITTYIPLTTLPGVFTAGQPTNPVAIIKGFYGLAIGAGSIIAVVMIVLAGFKYMYEESISGKSGAKEQIENAFLGLLVILGSYILLRTVNADLVNFNPILPGGTGTLSKMVAQDQVLKALQDQLHQAALDRTARLQTIDTLNTTLAEQDGQAVDLRSKIDLVKKQPQTAATAAVIADYQNQIAALETKKEATRNLITTKKTEDFAQTDAASITTARQAKLAQEISNVQHITDTGSDDDVQRAARTSLENISANTATQINGIKSRMNQAALLVDERCSDCEPTTSENIVSTYSQKASTDVDYLEKSKTMVDSMISSIDTVGTSGVKNTSAKVDTILADYEAKAVEFEKAGRGDLAQNLRNDMKSATELMKLRNLPNCKVVSDAQTLTLCKQ